MDPQGNETENQYHLDGRSLATQSPSPNNVCPSCDGAGWLKFPYRTECWACDTIGYIQIEKHFSRKRNKPLRRESRWVWADSTTHPEDWTRFREYAVQDTETLASVYQALPQYNFDQRELDIYHLDQRINDTGFRVDLELCQAAIELMTSRKTDICDELSAHTEGLVRTPQQRDKILEWLQKQGASVNDLKAETLQTLREDSSTDPRVLEVLELREQGSKASTAKLQAALNRVSPDGRLRGAYRICGAHTRRWSGSGFQPQNLKRVDDLYESATYRDYMVEQLLRREVDPAIHGSLHYVIGNLLRSAITAEKGAYLCPVDLSNIEGRVLAWLADEQWKLEAFRAYDRGEGPDYYVASYATTFGEDVNRVTKKLRQIGKIMELAFGYEGGVMAFLRFAPRDLDFAALAARTFESVSPAIRERAWAATQSDQERGTEILLPFDQWAALHAIKFAWRDKHPGVVSLWRETRRIWDLLHHGRTSGTVGRWLHWRYDQIYGARPVLRIILPSGQSLSYYNPELQDRTAAYHGVHGLSKKWWTNYTTGGKLVENIVQSMARDIFADGLLNAHALGVCIALATHDEIVGEGGPELAAITQQAMVTDGSKYPGLPIAAKPEKPAWRYGK